MTEDDWLELDRLRSVLRLHRWPWEPLAAALGGSTRDQARMLGVHERQIYRWRNHGLSDELADRCAIRAGLHPAIVWGQAWENVGVDPGQPVLEVA